MKDANDGLDEIIDPAIDQAKGLKRNHGRYTLEEAAAFISERTGEDAKGLRDKFIAAVKNGDLATYAPFSFVKKASGIVRDFFEHVYWNDLNEWLEKNEPRLNCKFPQPIEPVGRNAFRQYGVTTSYAKALERPDWSLWIHMSEVEFWEAIALSMNIEPKSLEKHPQAWMAGGSGSNFPDFTKNCFGGAKVKAIYDKRLLLLMNHKLGVKAVQLPRQILAYREPVNLRQFSLWALSFDDWDIPPELLALARKRVDVPEQTDAPAPSENVAPKMGGAGHTETASPTCKVFRDLPDLNARELSIEFVAGDSGTALLEISAREITKRVALAEIDLFDRRKAEMNEQAVILLGMAQKRRIQMADEKTARRISRLRTAIKLHLGIIDDPIANFRKGVGYEPRFRVTDKRDAADQRAKREAERKMVSLDELSENGVQVSDAAQSDYPFEDEDDEAAKLIRGN